MRTDRTDLAGFVNADPLDLVFTTNATVAMNIVARSIDLSANDEILTTDHEYGACDRMWGLLEEAHGFSTRRISLPLPLPTDDEIVEAIVGGMNDRTRLLFISHITSPTAVILPVERLCKAARERGILTVVDGAHAIGHVPLDLHEMEVDFYTSNLHKWLCAPKGSAFLFARREVQHLLRPLVTSWGGNPVRDYDSPFIAQHEYRGTREIAPALATGAAIAFRQKYRWDDVARRCHTTLDEVGRTITDMFGWKAITSSGNPNAPHLQMLSFILPSEIDGAALHSYLATEQKVEIPVVDFNGIQTIRVSVQGYNTSEDFERLYGGIRSWLDLRSES